jgi:LysM repeat protein
MLARLLAPLVLLAVAGAIALIVSSRHNAPSRPHPAAASHRRLPPYWTVRPGDTLGEIAARTGLSVALLQAYNPNANPLALTPGERLNLWRTPPQPKKPKAKPLGPTFWVVKPGQSFGSIAASTGIDITSLEQLNPQIKPSSIQAGDRVRLHH